MKRSPQARLGDILTACDAIASHLRANQADPGLVFDAVRVRLFEIGEATKALPDSLIANEPDVAWDEIARMRDHLAHHYFDTAHAVVFDTANHSVPLLAEATRRLILRIDDAEPQGAED